MSGEQRPEIEQAPPPAAAEVECLEQQGVHVLAISGEIDVSNVEALRAPALAIPNDALGMVLDLTATTFIDSATLGLIFELARSLARRCQELRIVSPEGSGPRRVLELAALDRITPCDEDRASAIEAIRGQQQVQGEAPPGGR